MKNHFQKMFVITLIAKGHSVNYYTRNFEFDQIQVFLGAKGVINVFGFD